MSIRTNFSFENLGSPKSGALGTPPQRAPRSWTWLVDAVLFGLFVYDGFSFPGIPVAIPVSELAALGLVLVSLLRRLSYRQATAQWLLPVFGLLLIFLVFSSIANEVDWFRRTFRIASLVALLWAISSGRVNLRSGLAGAAIALVVNAVLFYAGVAPDNYGGVLTGFLGDKNVAGLYHTIFPLLLAASCSSRRLRLVSVTAGLLAVFLTESRTSMGAYAAAIAWVLVSSKLPRIGRAFFGGMLILGLQYVEANLARTWIFTDREGSDLLRERIGQAAVAKTESAPWHGLGLGQANVDLEGRLWFFHDSYLGLQVEGGLIFLIVIVGIYLLYGLRPLSRRVRNVETIYVEAATIALLVCAWKLGEVFLSIPGFVLLGYAVKMNLSSGANERAEKLMK